MRRLRGVCLIACLAGFTLAYRPAHAAPAANPGETPEFTTKFSNTGKSLQSILDAGFHIVSSHLGIDTMGFVLERQGKWVTCSLRNTEKAGPDQMLSQCFALN